MDNTDVWKKYFSQWPKGVPQNGVVVTAYDEQVPFSAFLVRQDCILLKRHAPDSLGGRFLVIPYGGIQALKITEPLAIEDFKASGFVQVASK